MDVAGKSNLIEIALEKRMEKGQGVAFTQGEKDKDGREVWIWLPASQIEINSDGTVTMPEWLAKDKGLI